MVLGPARSRPSCAVSLSSHLQEVIPSCRYLGVVLTPSLRRTCRPHSRPWPSTFCTKAPRVPDPKAYLLPSRTSYSTCVLPNATFGTEVVGDCTRTLAQRRWGRHLGWALALFGRLHSLTANARVPLPAAVFALSQNTPRTWAHWCLSLLQHHAAGESIRFWCQAALLLSGHTPMVTSLCLSPVGSSIFSSSPSRPRPPLWSPLQSWSCRAIHPYMLDHMVQFHC